MTSTIRLDFETDELEERLVEIEAELDSPLAFLKEPFTGRFKFEIDGEDLMPQDKNRHPFAYAEWLIKNRELFTEQGEIFLFGQGLGDYSTKIRIQPKGRFLYVIPPIQYYGAAKIYSGDFDSEAERVSRKALEILFRNPRFRGSNRFSEMQKKYEENWIIF